MGIRLRSRTLVILSLTVILIVVVIGLLSYALISYGMSMHYDPQIELRHSQESWQQGNYLLSVLQRLNGYRIALEVGARYVAAEPFMRLTAMHDDNGNKQAALNECLRAATIIYPYDPEGTWGYQCAVIREKIWIEERCTAECDQACRTMGWNCSP